MPDYEERLKKALEVLPRPRRMYYHDFREAQDNHHLYTSCVGKVKYLSLASANAAIHGAAKARGGRLRESYACTHCDGWHLTSKRGKPA